VSVSAADHPRRLVPILAGIVAIALSAPTAQGTTPDPESIPFIKLRSDVWEIVIRRAGPGRAEVERVWAKCDWEWVNACYPDLDAASRQRALTSTFRPTVQLQGDFTYCSRVALQLPHDMARQLVRPSTSELCLALKGPGAATVYRPGDPATRATGTVQRGSQALPASRGTVVYKGGEMPPGPAAPAPIALDDGLEGVYTPPPAERNTPPPPDPELDALLGDVPQYASDGALVRPGTPPAPSAARPGTAPPVGAPQGSAPTMARAGMPAPAPIALDDGLEGVYTPPPAERNARPPPDPELDALLGDVPQYTSDGALVRPGGVSPNTTAPGTPPPTGAPRGSAAGTPPPAGAPRGSAPAMARAGMPAPEPIALDDGLEGVYTPPPAERNAPPPPDPELDALLGDVPQYASDGAIRRPAATPTGPTGSSSAAPAPAPVATHTPAPIPAPSPEKKKRNKRGPTELELEDQELANLQPIRRRSAEDEEAEEPIGVVGPRGRYLIIDIEALPEDDLVPERETNDWGFDPNAEPTDVDLD
jgi:hypothetical protein